MWNLEKEKKVGFILLPSTEYSPNFDHHKLCACMETAICSPSFRVRTFSCGPWQTFKRAALLQLPILYGSRWFQASWKYSRLKIRNLLFQLALHIPNKSLETPLALPWVHWDEHPAVLSNLVPQPGASMNAPCFPQSLLAQHVLFVGCVVSLFSRTSNPSCLYYFLLLGLRTSGWPHESMTPQQVESLALGLL